jgi:CRISPR-associated protein Csd2
MTTTMNADPVSKRYDFLYLFDVKDGNPNGDPDFDNTPRFDPETFQGLVSDVCLKRKIRDYVFTLKSQNGKPEVGYDIYVLQGHSLESRQKMPYENLEILKGKAKDKETDSKDIEIARSWMCQNFFDVRAFGAVMSTTKFRCGQVRGPVQITFGRSFHRILSSEHPITRVAYTTEEKKQSTSANTEFGHKHTVAYGLYCAYGFVNPNLSKLNSERNSGTGFNHIDLDILWKALVNMLGAMDATSARGLMAARNLFVFEHGTNLGEAPAHKLFELVEKKILLKDGVEVPRSYADYIIPTVTEIQKNCPETISVSDKVNL